MEIINQFTSQHKWSRAVTTAILLVLIVWSAAANPTPSLRFPLQTTPDPTSLAFNLNFAGSQITQFTDICLRSPKFLSDRRLEASIMLLRTFAQTLKEWTQLLQNDTKVQELSSLDRSTRPDELSSSQTVALIVKNSLEQTESAVSVIGRVLSKEYTSIDTLDDVQGALRNLGAAMDRMAFEVTLFDESSESVKTQRVDMSDVGSLLQGFKWDGMSSWLTAEELDNSNPDDSSTEVDALCRPVDNGYFDVNGVPARLRRRLSAMGDVSSATSLSGDGADLTHMFNGVVNGGHILQRRLATLATNDALTEINLRAALESAETFSAAIVPLEKASHWLYRANIADTWRATSPDASSNHPLVFVFELEEPITTHKWLVESDEGEQWQAVNRVSQLTRDIQNELGAGLNHNLLRNGAFDFIEGNQLLQTLEMDVQHLGREIEKFVPFIHQFFYQLQYPHPELDLNDQQGDIGHNLASRNTHPLSQFSQRSIVKDAATAAPEPIGKDDIYPRLTKVGDALSGFELMHFRNTDGEDANFDLSRELAVHRSSNQSPIDYKSPDSTIVKSSNNNESAQSGHELFLRKKESP